ncbi:MAG: M23 family metallopeptidase [Candidatus Cloacimonetes bacterium]|nr:M23 family metallopeptidase [Candidatus Cloacimonadota bacterium]
MSLQRKWYITFMQTDSARSVSLSISRKIGHFIVIFVLLLVVALGTGTFYVWKKNAELTQLSKLKKENLMLREKLEYFANQLEAIDSKLKVMVAWEDTLRKEKKLEIIDPGVRALGSGGEPYTDPSFLIFDTSLHSLYNTVLSKLNFIMSKTNLTYLTHNEIFDKVQSRESIFKSTPSIMPTFGKVTDKYGYRIHPLYRHKIFHAGIDIANDESTPIYATADGYVSFAGNSGPSGFLIRIEHDSGFQTRYAHLKEISVKVNQKVEKGQIIATMGNTGVSTGHHLHYEIFDYRKGTTSEPSSFFDIAEQDIRVPQTAARY